MRCLQNENCNAISENCEAVSLLTKHVNEFYISSLYLIFSFFFLHFHNRPNLLQIPLKRFQMNEEQLLLGNNEVIKNKSNMKIENKLSLKDYVESTESPHEYDIQAMIHHLGESPTSGHYTVDGLRDGVWTHFDDSKTWQTTFDVIGNDVVRQKTVYVLLYTLSQNRFVIDASNDTVVEV